MSNLRVFTKEKLIEIMESSLNKTLGEIDVNKVFAKTITNTKVTGIAGDVIEQSLLGYPSDNKQEPDILVDNLHYEVKTTGIKKLKKKAKFVAKEPMSITAVSPDKIVDETFENSMFWHKIERMLLVYYLYDSSVVVPASEYANFPIKGYQFKRFDEKDIQILKNDWKIIQDFIDSLQKNYEDYESEYPRISSELRPKLMYMDTAPKWPHNPRFRLKKSLVTSIVQEHFAGKLEQLPIKLSNYEELDNICSELTNNYSNMTVTHLINVLGMTYPKKIDKSINEYIVVNMFGGKTKKINQIEVFNKSGLVGKTITLTMDGKNTEDTKLFQINFNEIQDKNLTFEESEFYDFFANHQLLCIVFEEPNRSNSLYENKFIGFKRVSFDDKFIEEHIKPVWNQIRTLIFTNSLEDVISYNKNGNPILNKTGVIKSAPNFPKSNDNLIFVRGSGTDSSRKTLVVNNVRMYAQCLWIKGSYIAELIKK